MGQHLGLFICKDGLPEKKYVVSSDDVKSFDLDYSRTIRQYVKNKSVHLLSQKDIKPLERPLTAQEFDLLQMLYKLADEIKIKFQTDSTIEFKKENMNDKYVVFTLHPVGAVSGYIDENYYDLNRNNGMTSYNKNENYSELLEIFQSFDHYIVSDDNGGCSNRPQLGHRMTVRYDELKNHLTQFSEYEHQIDKEYVFKQ